MPQIGSHPNTKSHSALNVTDMDTEQIHAAHKRVVANVVKNILRKNAPIKKYYAVYHAKALTQPGVMNALTDKGK